MLLLAVVAEVVPHSPQLEAVVRKMQQQAEVHGRWLEVEEVPQEAPERQAGLAESSAGQASASKTRANLRRSCWN